MATYKKPRTRANGTWTEAQYVNFIRGNLRKTSMKWPPISQCLKDARVRRGVYLCAGCKQEVPASIHVNGKRVKNAVVDHIMPIVDPETGFVDWNTFIERLFAEGPDLQVLCHACHTDKTNDERARAKEARARKKDGE